MKKDRKANLLQSLHTEDNHWETLLRRVAQQDVRAFEEIFNYFSPMLKSFLQRGTGGNVSDQQSEELVQEVMLRIWQKASGFDSSKAKASTWIYTIARNCRIDLLYRKSSENMNTVDADDVWSSLYSDDSAIDELEEARNQKQVRESISLLPQDQREIIGKVFIEGKSHSEISNELQLPLGTVKSRVRLGMQKLRVSLSE